jgi:hypothetical protein
MTRNPWWVITSLLALALGAGLAQAQVVPIVVPELIPAPKCCCDETAPCQPASAACSGCPATTPCCPNSCTAGCTKCGTAAVGVAKCKCCEDCKCGSNCSCSQANNCCAACDCGKPNPSCAGSCANGAANCCYVYQLKHAQAAKVARAFADFLEKNQQDPKEIEVLANTACNQLIINTRVQCLGRLYRLIHELDVPEIQRTAKQEAEFGDAIGCQAPPCSGMCCPAGQCPTSEGCCSAKTKKSKHNHATQPAMIFVAGPNPPGIPLMPPVPPMMMPPNPGMLGMPENVTLPNPVPMPYQPAMPCQMVPPPVAPQPPRPAANVWVLRAVTEPATDTQITFSGMKVIQVKAETARARLEMQSADAKAICESMTLTCTAFGAPLQITAAGKKVVIAGSCLQATCDTLTNMGPDCGMVLKGNVELRYSQGDLKGEVKCDNAALDFAHGTLKLEGCVCLKHVKGDTQAQVKCGNLSIGLDDGKLEIKPSPAP